MIVMAQFSFLQGGSLSQLFVSFLENESSVVSLSGRPPLTPQSSAGKVDTRTDPDRPSRATAASLARPPHSVTPVPMHAPPLNPPPPPLAPNTLHLSPHPHTPSTPNTTTNTVTTASSGTSTNSQSQTTPAGQSTGVVIDTPLPPPLTQVTHSDPSRPRPEQKLTNSFIPSQRRQFSILNNLLSNTN